MSHICFKLVLQEPFKYHPLNRISVNNKGKVCIKLCKVKQPKFVEFLPNSEMGSMVLVAEGSSTLQVCVRIMSKFCNRPF